MQTLKFMFFSWNNPYSKGIQLVTKCKWSHTGIAIENENSFTVYEAIAKGLVKSDYTKEFINQCIKDGKVLIKQTETKYNEALITNMCDKYIGKSYDFLAIFYILQFWITKKAKKYDNVRYLFCSEFVARAGYDISNKKLDFSKEYNKSYELLTPADIFNSKQLTL